MTSDLDFDIERFAYAVNKYVEAKRDEEEARDQYEGYSWGYYGQDYFNRIDAAKAELTKAFVDAVKSVVGTV
jgi:hypothetical protein